MEFIVRKEAINEAPLWEWRCFGISSEELNLILQHQLPIRMRSESEIYLLSEESPHNCKIRLDRKILKVKALLEINDLELWQAVLRATFPLQNADIQILFESLGIENVPSFAATERMEDFLDELLLKAPDIQAVPVAKTRMIYRLDALELELAKVQLAEQETRFSLAAEHSDAEELRRFLEKSGLMGKYRNQNYSAWLKSRLHHFQQKQFL